MLGLKISLNNVSLLGTTVLMLFPCLNSSERMSTLQNCYSRSKSYCYASNPPSISFFYSVLNLLKLIVTPKKVAPVQTQCL